MTREEAIDVLKHNYPSACYTDLCEAVEIAIQALSTQPERKKGKWIDPAAYNVYRCSVCEKYTTLEVPRLFYLYCPKCGAEMETNYDETN